MQHSHSSPLDVSQLETGPLGKPKSPRDWGDLTVSILAPRARAGIEPREWIQAAIEHAHRERLDNGGLRYHGIKNGLVLYGVAKRSNPAHEWRITIDIPGQSITCSCPLHHSGLPCGHIGAIILQLRTMQDATATRACTHQRQIDLWSEALHMHG